MIRWLTTTTGGCSRASIILHRLRILSSLASVPGSVCLAFCSLVSFFCCKMCERACRTEISIGQQHSTPLKIFLGFLFHYRSPPLLERKGRSPTIASTTILKPELLSWSSAIELSQVTTWKVFSVKVAISHERPPVLRLTKRLRTVVIDFSMSSTIACNTWQDKYRSHQSQYRYKR